MTALADRARRYLATRLSEFRPWEDPDSGASPQRDFLTSAKDYPIRIFRAGNQSGKTMIGCIDAILRCIGEHPFARHSPPVRGWVVALDWEFGIGQVIWPTMREWLPMEFVQTIKWYRRGDLPMSIRFRNGSQIEFKSSDSGRKKFQGAALHFVWVDEEIPPEVIEEIRARLVRHGGDLWATLTPVRREPWVTSIEKEPITATIRASMLAAARAGILHDDTVVSFLESLPPRQRKVREFGDFAALEGLVYPEFTSATHVLQPRNKQLVTQDGEVVAPWPLPERWPRFAGVDFGYSNPTAIPLVVKDLDTGRLIVEKCLYASFMRASRWPEVIKECYPALSSTMVADWDREEREEFRAMGVDTTPAFKEIVIGIEEVERKLHIDRKSGLPGLMFVVHPYDPPRHKIAGTYDCRYIVTELENYRYPEARDSDRNAAKDVPIDNNNHALDALRYLCMHLKRLGHAPGPGRVEGRIPDMRDRFKVSMSKEYGK